MSIYENTRQMKELLAQVLSNDTQEIQENHLSSFATPKLYEKPLMESEGGDEDDQEFIVTEGWNEEDISELFEKYSEEEIEDALNEGIFSGIHPHTVQQMAHEYSDYKAGEHSPVETHEVSNKSQTHQAIAGKMGSHHVIVKHNGKVVATIHPQQNEARPEFKAHDGEGNVEKKNRLTKGEALEHVHSAIDKAGGYKSTTPLGTKKNNKVELHFIGKDKERPNIARERHRNSAMNDESPKLFKNIAAKAADKITGVQPKDPVGAEIHLRRAKEHKENLDKALSKGNHYEAAQHAEKLASVLHKADDAASIRRSSAQRQARWGAQDIGHRQDTNHKNNLVDNSNANEFKQAVRRAKSGETY